ncbi:hypothetical protein FrEUN1fDRAFT_7649 [Parafrankia sp. EUN1f]|nr:hypothetical protein FrEUN1fDRAFT_7649 [Parafrankia sp. EUN1f]
MMHSEMLPPEPTPHRDAYPLPLRSSASPGG